MFANPAALRLFHADGPVDLLGRPLHSLATPAFQAEAASAIKALRENRPFRTVEEQARDLQEGENPEALLRFSDAAIYHAKQMGRNNMNAIARSCAAGATKESSSPPNCGLRSSAANSLHHQLQVDLHTGTITGLEALLRWSHPILGNIPPARFIPIAEETGRIEPITEWVLQQACA